MTKDMEKTDTSSLKAKMVEKNETVVGSVIPIQNEFPNNSPILSSENDAILDQNKLSVQVEAEKSKAVAEIQASLIMAQKFPRNESVAFAKMARSLDRVNFAKNCLYAFPRGGRTIEGPGIVLAREFARCWGNMRYGITIIHETEDDRTIEGWAWDLETNVHTAAQATFAKLIYRKAQGWIKPDERDLRELSNKHGSLCVRNAILQLIPQDIIDDCVIKAKSVAKNGVDPKNMKQQRAGIINLFDPFGISASDLEEYIGTKSDNWTPDMITKLNGIANGLKDGNISRDEILKKDNKGDN